MASATFTELRRRFCDDQRETLGDLAGTFGTALLDQLKRSRLTEPTSSGTSTTSNTVAFTSTSNVIRRTLATGFEVHGSGLEHSSCLRGPQGRIQSCPCGSPTVMAIGVKADHIFQGIIYGKPRHPLLRQAIQHAFGRQDFTAKVNLDYMIFCKDMGQNPRVGWNISPTCMVPFISFKNAMTERSRRSTTTRVTTS